VPCYLLPLQTRKQWAALLLPTLKTLSRGSNDTLFFQAFELYFALGIDNPPAKLPAKREVLMQKLDSFLRSEDGLSTKAKLSSIAKRFKEGECAAKAGQSKPAFTKRIEAFINALHPKGAQQPTSLRLGRGFGLFGWSEAKRKKDPASRWIGFAAYCVAEAMLDRDSYASEKWNEIYDVIKVKDQLIDVMQATKEPSQKDEKLLEQLFENPVGIFTVATSPLLFLRFGKPCDDAGRALRGYQKLLEADATKEKKKQWLENLHKKDLPAHIRWKGMCGFRNARGLFTEALKEDYPLLAAQAEEWLVLFDQAVQTSDKDQSNTWTVETNVYRLTEDIRHEGQCTPQRIVVQGKESEKKELDLIRETITDALRGYLNDTDITVDGTAISNPIPKDWADIAENRLPAVQKFWAMLKANKVSDEAGGRLMWLLNQLSAGNEYALIPLWRAAKDGYSLFLLRDDWGQLAPKAISVPVKGEDSIQRKVEIDKEKQTVIYTCTQIFEERSVVDPTVIGARYKSTSRTEIAKDGEVRGNIVLERIPLPEA
jgi:hypothetical protein